MSLLSVKVYFIFICVIKSTAQTKNKQLKRVQVIFRFALITSRSIKRFYILRILSRYSGKDKKFLKKQCPCILITNLQCCLVI